jgi:hypothetical protein
MEMLCRRQAKLDKKTAQSWLEEAELWSKLKKIEQRLQTLRHVRPDEGRGKGIPNLEA